MRITHLTHRSPADIEAELDFVRFLARHGQGVSVRPCGNLPMSIRVTFELEP